ncbi:MAG: isochorismatase family protein [Holophaga sp.]|nr:isochorismatase family protein [Holophaga sp.]
MATVRPALQDSALLVIDVQDSFKASGRWERRSNPQLEANVDRLVQAYRAAGLPVFFVLHSDRDAAFQTTSPHYKLMDFLRPRPEEPVLHKITRNCFTSTPLQRLLTQRGVRHLAITGIQMEQCCETTTRLAADLGYQVDFVLDATLTFPIPHMVDGQQVGELGVAEIAERTCFVLRDRFARIVDTAQLLGELRDQVK